MSTGSLPQIIYKYPNGIIVQLEEVTPERCAEDLASSSVANRPGSYAYEVVLGDMMVQKRWRPLRDTPIYYDKKGNLLNGGHRFRVMVRYNVTMWMICVYGCDRSDIEIMDVGKNRSMRDALIVSGMTAKATDEVGTVARYLQLAREGNLHRIRNDRSRTVLDRMDAFRLEPEVYHSYKWVKSEVTGRKTCVLIHTPTWALMHYLVKVGGNKAQMKRFLKFFHLVVFEDGNMLKPGTPEYALRDWLQRHSRMGKRSRCWDVKHTTEVCGPHINAWGAYDQGFPMQSCAVHPSQVPVYIRGCAKPVATECMPYDPDDHDKRSVKFQGDAVIS